MLAVSAVLGTILATAILAAGQEATPVEVSPAVPGVGGGLAASFSVGTISADPCALYEPNSSCINARGETESLGFGDSHTWKLRCSDFNGEFPYVHAGAYSIDTTASKFGFTDPGIPLDFYQEDPVNGALWLAYSITVTNLRSKHDFAPVLACF